jgi:hypothetical protein
LFSEPRFRAVVANFLSFIKQQDGKLVTIRWLCGDNGSGNSLRSRFSCGRGSFLQHVSKYPRHERNGFLTGTAVCTQYIDIAY